MIPTTLINNKVATLLAADSTTLAPATDANHVHLVTSPFTPSPNTDFTTLTEATFTGGTAKAAGTGAQQAFTDPLTGNRIVQLLEPAGGWHWQCTAAPGTPEIIYGFVVTDNADLVTYGSQLFDAPITIGAVGDAIDIPEVRYTILPGMIS